MRRRLGVLVVGLGLTAGAACSAGPSEQALQEAPPPSVTRTASAEPFPGLEEGDELTLEDVEAVEPAPGLDEDAAADLAELAEQQAEEQREQRAGVPSYDGSPVEGADISWPNCETGLGIPQRRTLGLPMPLPAARYVVVGLTNGPGFYPNPCLADQVAWVRERSLLLSAYAVVSYPSPEELERFGGSGPYDADTAAGALSNTGYQQALYHSRSMRETGLDTPLVWVDVEPVRDFEWSADTEANAAVVAGTVRGYRDAGYDIGVYSTPYLWDTIVGEYSLEVPEWRAAGPSSRSAALGKCEDAADLSIQGGEPVLAQWVDGNRDRNLTCPGVSRDLGRYFAATG